MRCEDCASIIVWTVPHLEPAVQAAAERVNDGCFRYAVAPRADASGQAALLGGERPDVWIPVSAAWPGLVAQDGVQLQVGETIASSPVLLAGAAPVINALEQSGVGPETTWAQVVQQVLLESRATGEQAPFEMRVGDPRSDAATMSLLSTTGSQAGGWTEADSRRGDAGAAGPHRDPRRPVDRARRRPDRGGPGDRTPGGRRPGRRSRGGRVGPGGRT